MTNPTRLRAIANAVQIGGVSVETAAKELRAAADALERANKLETAEATLAYLQITKHSRRDVAAAEAALAVAGRLLTAAARPIRDAYLTDPGTWDLDDEQPIHISTTLGAWRKLDRALVSHDQHKCSVEL